MDKSVGYKLIKKPGFEADSAEGQDLIGKILASSEIGSFPFSIPAGARRPPDYHSVDCVAFVEDGALNMGFGEGYADQVRAEAGDFLFIEKNAAHKESTDQEQGVHLKLFYSGDFQVFGA